MQTAMRIGLCSLLSIVSILSCKNGTSTTGLLDASFVTNFKLYMSVPGDVIYDGKDFDMKLEAKAAATSLPLKGISGSITWTLTGGGTMTFVSCPDMKEGVQICRMRYSASLTAGQTKVIKLQAKHDATNESVSDSYTVGNQTFSVSVPSRINANTTFTATITAIDPIGGTNTNFVGTVTPYLALMPGRPSIDEISNFVNGVATVQMKIHKSAWQMQLAVFDKTNALASGTSNIFRVVQNDANYVALDLIAVPLSATSNRLSWTYLDSSIVNSYKIYRKDSSGIYQLIFTESTTTKSYYVDTGLTTGVTYDYKVEAVDSGSAVLSTDFGSATPKACTVVTASPVGYTVWTKAQSPYCGNIALSLTSSLVLEPGTIVLWNGGGQWSGGGQLLKAMGTPNERIIFSSSSATPAGGHFPGFGVTSLNAAIMDGSGNYVSGSIWKYVVLEYGAGAYWQAASYTYQSFIMRYLSSGFTFENSNTVLDGGVIARNSTGFATKGPQTSKVSNLIFFRNSSDVSGGFWVKTDVATSTYNFQFTGNYFAYNAATASSVLPGGALTLDPQAPGTTAVGGTYQITDNQFFYNTNQAQGFNGGAIRAGLYGTPNYTISNNTFVSNTSANGGAISIENAAGYSMTMNNNLFQQNSATTNGGGVRVAGGSAAITATNNQFLSNTATNGKNFFNGVTQNHNLQNSYWDGVTDMTCAAPQRLALGVADSCGGGGSGTLNLTGVVATQYSLCINDPTISGCIGAR